jgi:uncharacterized protein (TIGR01777 family)
MLIVQARCLAKALRPTSGTRPRRSLRPKRPFLVPTQSYTFSASPCHNAGTSALNEQFAIPASSRRGICQSATGYYGAHDEEPLDEDAPPGTEFLAHVVVEWEQEATFGEDLLRVVKTRTGVVLSPSGGALGAMLPAFRLGLGGPVGDGRQYVPWIHLDDVVQATLRCLEDEGLSGPVNLTAPTPVTNRAFTKALGRALERPAVLPIPSWGLRILYGEMAEVITTGARALPARLERTGYQFLHQEIEAALRDVLAKSR